MAKSGMNVTVGIPFHGGVKAEHLCCAVESILTQTCIPREIHLIQDGPVERDVRSIVETFMKNHSNLVHIELEENVGLPAALNRSINLTSTTFYARMDADDIAHPERLERQLKFLSNNPHVDIVGTAAYEFVRSINERDMFLKMMPKSNVEMRRMFHYRSPLIHPSVIFRMSVFDRIGLYNPRFRKAQDLELWARAFKQGVILANIPEPLLFFRLGSLSKRRSGWDAVRFEIWAKYSFNTLSPRLNCLKLASISLRFLPLSIQRWAYKNLR